MKAKPLFWVAVAFAAGFVAYRVATNKKKAKSGVTVAAAVDNPVKCTKWIQPNCLVAPCHKICADNM